MSRITDNFLLDSARAVVHEARQLSPDRLQQIGLVALGERKWNTVSTSEDFRIAVLEEKTGGGHLGAIARLTWPYDMAVPEGEPPKEYYLTIARMPSNAKPTERWIGVRAVGQTVRESVQPDNIYPLTIYREAERKIGHLALQLLITRLPDGLPRE